MTIAARTIGLYPEKVRLCVIALLAALGQPLLAQSAIETALAATVTIVVAAPEKSGLNPLAALHTHVIDALSVHLLGCCPQETQQLVSISVTKETGMSGGT